jgi:RNA polymerase sigma-70 factor (ECF subfamily)
MDAPPRTCAPSEQLLAAARGGDAPAFWQLAEGYRPYLKTVAARLLGDRLAQKVDASDVVQQGLLAAFEQAGQFQGQKLEQWYGWVVAIVRHEVHSLVRYWHRERRDVRCEQRLAPGSDGDSPLAAEGSSPSQQAARREQVARLLAAVQQLPPDYQQVLHLRNFEQLPYAEVARRMDRSEQAVRQLWMRAVRWLREELGDEA